MFGQRCSRIFDSSNRYQLVLLTKSLSQLPDGLLMLWLTRLQVSNRVVWLLHSSMSSTKNIVITTKGFWKCGSLVNHHTIVTKIPYHPSQDVDRDAIKLIRWSNDFYMGRRSSNGEEESLDFYVFCPSLRHIVYI